MFVDRIYRVLDGWRFAHRDTERMNHGKFLFDLKHIRLTAEGNIDLLII